MPRIISGEAKGVTINVPPGLTVRPTQDKVKGAIFSAIGDLNGDVVVDLFAGSGNMGCEALSRGATEVYMFEQDLNSVGFIEKNLKGVEKSICAYGNRSNTDFTVKIVPSDALKAPQLLPALKGRVDVIMADPPYIPESHQKGPIDVLTSVELSEWMADDGFMVLESGPLSVMELSDDIPWIKIKSKNYGGGTCISYWKPRR